VEEDEEERMTKSQLQPKLRVKNAAMINLLLAEIAAARREMVRLRRMLRELIGEVATPGTK
jgi:hypothetical protein